ncbi:hypothetical protein HanRHA438_Chr06g0276531 [Helianthus annuus]|nr:hypothetical protein HanHA89_Chr07g0255861 [Helianthus annuus]KAJ0574166.1 hypothetical protein HanHA89_Chr06g0235071 [Helianthus annuus]KAJ0730948.1 hypothetical protein HanOQP8_Chr07g0246271 [Helianthus annuus]KAJ0738500.1 hypothetical protein HanLR1_Chr06g0218991 [Helianthus annuus]KAJ0753300.1 hypothetical protein HanPI659440_Chr09g0334101 [Helianthus annuus]
MHRYVSSVQFNKFVAIDLITEEINVIHSGTTTLSLSSRKCSIGLDVHSMLHSRAWVPFQVPMIDRRRLDYTMPL